MSPPPPLARFKNEISPNNRSKCYGCGNKITKGEQRYGAVEFNDYGRIQRYYHPDCCPADAKRKIPSLEESAVVGNRTELWEELRRLRSLFAEELQIEPFKIFHDKSLKELVTKMPTTEEELLQIWGIKYRKVFLFGSAILSVIRQYLRDHHGKCKGIPVVTPPKKRRRKNPQRKDPADHEDVAGGETLTFEQILQRKIEEARRNGHFISVDDDNDEDDEAGQEPSKPGVLEYSEMKISSLMTLCKERNIDTKGFVEKSELVRALKDAADQDEVCVGEMLTCEQIVQGKFEEGRRNGYVISVDDYEDDEDNDDEEEEEVGQECSKPGMLEYSEMKISSLKTLCKERNIDTKGIVDKSELVRALMDNYSNLSISALRALCKDRGISTQGMVEKCDLIEALKK